MSFINRLFATAICAFSFVIYCSSANAILFNYTYTGNLISGEFAIDVTPDNKSITNGDLSLLATAEFVAGALTLTEADVQTFDFETDSNGEIDLGSVNFVFGLSSLIQINGLSANDQFEFFLNAGNNDSQIGPIGSFAFVDDGQAVSEPGSLALLGIGLFGLGYLRYFSRQRKIEKIVF